MDYADIFTQALALIKQEDRYRVFHNIIRTAGQFPKARDCVRGQDIIVWCINDYLGMGQHPRVIDAAIKASKEMGVGAGGTRNIGGTHHPLTLLESELADLHATEAALVFTSGYVANDTTLSTLGKVLPDPIFISDQNNHASIIAGIRHAQCQKYIFKHNNIEHLESILKTLPLERPKVIVFESIYSMEGDIAPIKEICALAKRYHALTYIDEVHSVGLYGKRGAGLAAQLGCMQDIDIIQGTLGKAYGVIGGYIAGSHVIIDTIRSYGSGFIFTTSLPPALAAAALASIQHLKHSDTERLQHQAVISLLKKRLRDLKINFLDNAGHIISIMIYNANRAKKVSEILLQKYNIYVQHINYPTVPKGLERLRITPTPLHTPAMIENFVQALKTTLKEYPILIENVKPQEIHTFDLAEQ